MNYLSTYRVPEAPYLIDQRENHRNEIINLLVVTERGTGQILDIHREGLSFGCLYPHTFPNEFFIDILDAKGSHIKKIKVQKMWETIGDYQEPGAMFELVVGVEFSRLTSSQESKLEFLLENNLESADYSYQYLL